MATSTSIEIIDLTNSPPPQPITIDDSDNEPPLPEPDTLSPNKSMSRSRSKREKSRKSSNPRKSAVTDSPRQVERDESGVYNAKNGRRDERRGERESGRTKRSSTEQMRHHGSDITQKEVREEGEVEEERSGGSRKNRRKRGSGDDEQALNITDDQLFFIDTKPIAGPRIDDIQAAGPSTDTSRSTAPSKPDSDASKLLLPAHVTLWDLDFGVDSAAPVDIILPTQKDSDTESYIDYLDYDDRPVRFFVLWNLDSSNSQAKRHSDISMNRRLKTPSRQASSARSVVSGMTTRLTSVEHKLCVSRTRYIIYTLVEPR